MTLCKECNNEISENAEQCPKCGGITAYGKLQKEIQGQLDVVNTQLLISTLLWLASIVVLAVVSIAFIIWIITFYKWYKYFGYGSFFSFLQDYLGAGIINGDQGIRLFFIIVFFVIGIIAYKKFNGQRYCLSCKQTTLKSGKLPSIEYATWQPFYKNIKTTTSSSSKICPKCGEANPRVAFNCKGCGREL